MQLVSGIFWLIETRSWNTCRLSTCRILHCMDKIFVVQTNLSLYD